MQTEINYDGVFDAQQHFRVLLDSMSRPGKINGLPAMNICPPHELQIPAALVGLALLNNDVTFYVKGKNSEHITEYLLVNTGAQSAEMDAADYIFIPEFFYDEELYSARTGTAIYPEDSATIIAQSNLISAQPHEGALELNLKGPGVNGELNVYISGLSRDLLSFLKIQNEEYPLGIDVIITDKMNNVMGLPRSNKFVFV